MFVRIYQKTRISIHAPTRGATVATSRVKGCSADFNPRSHERSDDSGVYDSNNTNAFQSTLPRGERRKRKRESKTAEHFNPRSHERSEEHTSELQSVEISYAVFCLKKKKKREYPIDISESLCDLQFY